ncbi:MAG: hypothetical protein ABL962_09125 [Fimbriimonadaceae bacterium]
MEEIFGIIAGILFVAACVALGLVCAAAGFCTGLWFWWVGLCEALKLPGPENTGSAEPLYLHHRAWIDLEKAARLGWRKMEAVTKVWFASDLPPIGIGLGVGAYAGTLCCLSVCSLLHGLGVSFCTVASYSVQWSLQLVEFLRIKILHLSPPCHNCNRYYTTPIFLCECGVEHPALAPGKFGYAHHMCRCGKVLPALSWNQKPPMVALCPKPLCRQSVDPTRRMPICIALAGGPSQGKTHVLIRAVQDLLLRRTVAAHWMIEPYQDADRQTIDTLLRQHEHGTVDKTLADVPRALNLRIRFHPDRPERLLYLYDPGGEAFQSHGNLSHHPYLMFADALLFAIDPFALPQLVDAHALMLEPRHLKSQPDDISPTEAFTNFKNTLWSAQKLSLKARCRLPLCIVLTKMDANGMLELVATMPGANTSDRCKQFLSYVGQSELVDRIERNFITIRFFALGEYGPEINSPNAERTGDAIAWAIRHRQISPLAKLLHWLDMS